MSEFNLAKYFLNGGLSGGITRRHTVPGFSISKSLSESPVSAMPVVGLLSKNKETAKKNLKLVLFLVDENLWRHVSGKFVEFQEQLLEIDKVLQLWKFYIINDEPYNGGTILQRFWERVSKANKILRDVEEVILNLRLTESQSAQFRVLWLDVYHALEKSRFTNSD